jgi:hypothetical protein
MAIFNRGRRGEDPGPPAGTAEKFVERASVATVATVGILFLLGLAESAREYLGYEARRGDVAGRVAGALAGSKALQGLVHDSCYSIPSIFGSAPNNHQLQGLRSGRLQPNDPNVVWPVVEDKPHFHARWFTGPVSRGVVVRAIDQTMGDIRGLPLTAAARPEINATYRSDLRYQLRVTAAAEQATIAERVDGARRALAELRSDENGWPLLTAFGYFIDDGRDVGVTPGPAASAVPARYDDGRQAGRPALSIRQAVRHEPLEPYCLIK